MLMERGARNTQLPPITVAGMFNAFTPFNAFTQEALAKPLCRDSKNRSAL